MRKIYVQNIVSDLINLIDHILIINLTGLLLNLKSHIDDDRGETETESMRKWIQSQEENRVRKFTLSGRNRLLQFTQKYNANKYFGRCRRKSNWKFNQPI